MIQYTKSCLLRARKSSLCFLVLTFFTLFVSGCSNNDSTALNPEMHVVSSTTMTIANHNSWDWQNVSVIIDPKNVSTSNFPKHGQYIMQYQGFLWQTKKIKAGQKLSLYLGGFVDNQGKHLAPGRVPSAIDIETFQSNKNELASYYADFSDEGINALAGERRR